MVQSKNVIALIAFLAVRSCYAQDLRGLVESVINLHLPQHALKVLKIAEQSERELITKLVRQMGGASHG